MIELGDIALRLALLMAVWGTALSFSGQALARTDFISSGTRGLHASTGFTALAAAGLWWGFVSGDFSVRFVAAHSNESLPGALRVSAFWAGRAGLLLLWSLLFSCCASVVLLSHARARTGRRPTPDAKPGMMLGVVLAASLTSSVVFDNPFSRLGVAAADGRGLEPALQHWASAIEAPMALLGWSAAIVASLLMLGGWRAGMGRELRVRRAGRWSFVAFAFLAASVELHAWWSYAHGGVAPSISAMSAAGWTPLFSLVALALLVLVGGRRRRSALVLLVTGAALLAAGLAGTRFVRAYDVALSDGESFTAVDAWGTTWTFTSQGASRIERPNYALVAVALLPLRAGVRQPFVTAELRRYDDESGSEPSAPESNPALRSSALQDLAVTVRDVGDGRAGFHLAFIPLASCIWLGGAALIAAALAALAPRHPAPEHRR